MIDLPAPNRARISGLFSSISPRVYLAHCKRELLDTLVSDPRLCYLAMAGISFICIGILAWPGETLDGPGFRILSRWMDDASLIGLLALHMAGMLRAIVKLKERPLVDKWAKRLGFALFGGVAASIDLSLGRVTFLSGISFGVAALAFWLMLTKNRVPAGVTP